MPATMLLEFTDPAAAEASLAGGKGASLARLTRGGFAVPPGIVVPAPAYRLFLASVEGLDGMIAALRPGDASALHEQCAAIRARLVAHPLPAELEEALRARLPALLDGGRVSVRSSATLEDLAGAAFAGQHDTYLNVEGVDGVLDAVRRCWASLWEDRAVRYRHERGFGVAEAAMAVVVQRMVASEVAGVAFSMNPVSGDLGEIVINSAFGLGETVVSGEGGIDQFVISKHSVVAKKGGEVLQRVIGTKTHALLGEGRVELPPERRDAPSLSDDELARLADLALRVERFYAFPQDIEWALAGGELYLLQSRPVTEFPARWTRDESAERFPNPVTPLTWDFTTEGFHESLSESLALLGYPPFTGKWFERIDGYVYGNQTAVQLFTAGLQVRFDSLDELAAKKDEWAERYRWVQELPVTWARDLDRYLLTLGRFSSVDLATLGDEALWRHLVAVDTLGREYFRPNIAISITQGVLHRTLFAVVAQLVGREGAPALYDALTCFCDTKTNLVNGDLYRLYLIARQDPELEWLLTSVDRRAFWEGGPLARFPVFEAAFRRFLENHGHREVDFDAYVPTWSGQPWTVLENLRLMLLQGEISDPATREAALRARQSQAERDYLAALPAALRNFGAELLRLTRAYTALDDLEHYQTTRLSIPFRDALVEIGRRLVKRGVLATPEDVFFLHKTTLTALMDEGGDAAAAAEEARREKAAYRAAHATTPPRVHGEEPEPAGDALRGLPGSPGVAEGPVCLVHGVEDFARFTPGSVLVARTTNPAWTPLFYSAVAVVTESGGPLSHGAVTAREVGVPAVMAVHGALTSLRDGERVRVNGGQGLVSRVVVTVLALLLALAAPLSAQAPGLLDGVRRVLFLGNSITYAGDYVADVETALLARGVEVEFLNLGLPSETATELTAGENAEHLGRHGFGRPFLGERLERVLAATRPEIVFASYGINDGSSLPATEESVRRFGASMEELRALAARYGVRRVIHLTPPVYDAAASPTVADYDPMLARFTGWLLARRADGWSVVDVHTPMRRALDERRAREPAFAFARDGVHPSREGHALMAREILAFLGDGAAIAPDEELRALVRERMVLLRDAWLARTGHTRPGLAPGLPLEEARARAEEITGRIHSLRRTAAP